MVAVYAIVFSDEAQVTFSEILYNNGSNSGHSQWSDIVCAMAVLYFYDTVQYNKNIYNVCIVSLRAECEVRNWIMFVLF